MIFGRFRFFLCIHKGSQLRTFGHKLNDTMFGDLNLVKQLSSSLTFYHLIAHANLSSV